jgi:hypothetical protein
MHMSELNGLESHATPLAMPQRKPKRTWRPAANKVTTTKAQPKATPKADNARTRRQRRNGGSRFVN